MNFMWNGMNSRAPPAKSSPLLHFSREMIGVMRGLGIFLHVEKELVRGCSGSISWLSEGHRKEQAPRAVSGKNLRRKPERRMVKLKPSCAVRLQCG